MAIHTNFFSDGSTVNGAADFIAPWLAAFSDGVFGAGDFVVTADSPADLAVLVAAGRAMKSGHFVNSDAAVSVPISANTSGYNRIDMVVLQVDDTNNATTIKVVQGTPSSSPTVPILQSNQLPLAQITVGNNVSVINSNVIMDMRYPVLPYGAHPGKGEPFYGPASAVPWDRLIADGRAVSRAQYARLFSVIGTAWGAGDGSTTFNLPDGRGATFAGYKSGDANYGTLGARIGSDTHTQSFVSPISYTGTAPLPMREDSFVSYNAGRANVEIHSVTNYTQTGSAQAQNTDLYTISMSGSSIQPSNVGLWLIAW